MSLRNGEYGNIIYVNADFDMTANTDMQLVFVKPDLTTLTVNKAGGVSAPNADVTDPDDATVTYLANKYWKYTTASGDIDQAGQWSVHGTYTDATPKFFIGAPDTFVVLA
jgi:hypothetical protein